MIYSSRAVSAAEAFAIGLVDRVLQAEDFDRNFAEWAAAIAAGSRFTLRTTKAVLQTLAGYVPPLEDEVTLTPFVDATQGPDFREGVAAFLEKRLPKFSPI